MKQAPQRKLLQENQKAPRQFLFRQLRPAVMVVIPGGRHLGAYHEHSCPICGDMTGGLGKSLCPKRHAQQELADFWGATDETNILTKRSSTI